MILICEIKLLYIFLLITQVFGTDAQHKKDLAYYQCAFFESYRAGNMAPWPGLIAEMEIVKPADLAWQMEMVKAMYGMVGYLIGAGKKDQAKIYVFKAAEEVDKLLDDHPGNAQLHSLSGALYGYKIALAFYKAPFLGLKSLWHIEKSIELDPGEPMGYTEKGNSLLYRPAAFGGDKKEAFNYYRKALKLMESRTIQNCNWQHLLLRAFILKGLYETNQIAEAKVFQMEMKKDYGNMDWVQQFVGAKFIDGK